jgi:hypothetical protein
MTDNDNIDDQPMYLLDDDSKPHYLPLNVQSHGSYSKLRIQNKSGVFSSLLILLRATTSIGVLTNQFYFILNGYIYSPLIIILLMLAIGFCINKMLQICNHIESKNIHFIEHYEDIMMHLSISLNMKKFMYVFAKVLIISCVFFFSISVLFKSISSIYPNFCSGIFLLKSVIPILNLLYSIRC